MGELELQGIEDVEVKTLYVGGDGFLASEVTEDQYDFLKLEDYKYQSFIKDMLENPDKDIKEYLYYKDKKVSRNWFMGRDFTAEECIQTTKRMVDLLNKIKTGGYTTEYDNEVRINKLGFPWGPVTGLLLKDKTLIIDGYHRSSIALALGIKTIPIILFKEII